MKRTTLAVLTFIFGLSAFAPSTPALAYGEDDKHCVDTIILGPGDHKVCDEDGQSIFALVSFIISIMTIGVGILGVIGISVTGIQYLTAGGNEEQTRKAKRRMFEIIIGLAVYAVFFVAMQWLVKDFDVQEGSWNSGGSSAEETPSGGSSSGESSPGT